MTRQAVCRVPRRVAVFTAAVTSLLILVSLCQIGNAGQVSALTSSLSAPPQLMRGAQTSAHSRSTERVRKQFGSGKVKKGAEAPLFLPAVTYSTGGSDAVFANDSSWVSVEDVNRDGIPDILVANWCANSHLAGCPADGNVGVLIGNGDGTFKPVVTYASGDYYAFIVIAQDVNRDGKVDLLVGNGCLVGVSTNCPSSSSVGVLLGNGDGTFQAVQNYPSGGLLSWMTVTDVNGDGKPDLIVTNRDGGNNGEGSVGVLLGKGDGTFEPVQTYTSGGSTADFIAVADVNSDGKSDLLVANPTSCANCVGNIGVLLGNGDGTFQPVFNYVSGYGVNVIVVADLNSDGKLDLLVNAGGSFDGGQVIVMLGNGDGSFQTAVAYSSGGMYNTTPIVLDLNGDHKLDLAIANGQGCPATGESACAGVLLGNGDGTFQPALQFGLSGAAQLAAADINGDGRTDLLAVSQCGPKGCSKGHGLVEALLGNGDGTFQPATSYDSGAYYGSWIGTADLDGDGRLDVVAVSANSGNGTVNGSVSVLMSNATLLPATATALTSSQNPSNFGQAVTLTAVVSSAVGAPTGTVIFYDGSTAFGSATLTSGSAALSTSSLAAGTHSITATYQGSGEFAPSTSAVLSQVVNPTGVFSSKTVLATSGSPSFAGQSVIFTAKVTSAGGAIPDGELVTFYDGGKTIGTGATAGGVATFGSSSLMAKKHTIKATYSGDGTFKPSSGVVTQVVERYATTTTSISSLNPATYGQSVTFTATVTSTGPTPTGKVKFTGIGEATLSGGVATFTKTHLRAGSYAITAEYLGDDESAKSDSSVLDEVVNPASTSTALTSSANPSSSGQTVTFTATVTSSTGLAPFGTVTFTAGGTTLGTVALKNMVVKFSTATLPTGSTTITATYNGAAGFTGSSASLTQTVQP